MLLLNNLREKAKSTKNRKRVGRGMSGKRPGHGEKGQKARSGVALGNFQGGQNPIERRLPKQRSFFTGDKLESVSLETISRLLKSNALSLDSPIDSEKLLRLKVIKGKKFKVIGKCDCKISVEASSFSEGALISIKENKGTYKVV